MPFLPIRAYPDVKRWRWSLLLAMVLSFASPSHAQNTLYALTGDGKLFTIDMITLAATPVRAPLAPLPASTWFSSLAIRDGEFFTTYSFNGVNPHVVQFGTTEGDETDLGAFDSSGAYNINALALGPDGELYAPVYRVVGSTVYMTLATLDLDERKLLLHSGDTHYQVNLGSTSSPGLQNINGTFNGLAFGSSNLLFFVFGQYYSNYQPIQGVSLSGNLPTIYEFESTGGGPWNASWTKILMDANYQPVSPLYVRGVVPNPLGGNGFYYVAADPRSPKGTGAKLFYFDPSSTSGYGASRSTLIGYITTVANITGIAFGPDDVPGTYRPPFMKAWEPVRRALQNAGS